MAMKSSILLVDDHEEGVDSLAEVLRMCGHSLRVASSSPAALAEAAAQMPDVLISDLG